MFMYSNIISDEMEPSTYEPNRTAPRGNCVRSIHFTLALSGHQQLLDAKKIVSRRIFIFIILNLHIYNGCKLNNLFHFHPFELAECISEIVILYQTPERLCGFTDVKWMLHTTFSLNKMHSRKLILLDHL